jgi:hypothetical protein
MRHSRKFDKADSEAHVGTLDSLRGASSQGGVIRKAETMYTPSAKDEKRYRFERPRQEWPRQNLIPLAFFLNEKLS